MTKVSFQTVPVGFETVYKNALCAGDRFTASRVRVKQLFLSRDRVKGITQKSIMPAASLLWNGLTQGERDAWESAGAVCNLSGWRLFLRDYGYRLKNGMEGVSTPNDLYQVEVGLLRVESPATALKIYQLHPYSFYIYKKVSGTKSQYDPVHLTEGFVLPFTLSCSYRTNLTSAGASPRARMWVDVLSHYQGRDIHTEKSIEMGLTDEWQTASVSVTSVLGVARGYTVFVEVKDAQGDLFFDNVSFSHSGFNWARDFACNDIDQSFTKAYAQIPKHWVADTVAEGAFFGSVYYNKIIE